MAAMLISCMLCGDSTSTIVQTTSATASSSSSSSSSSSITLQPNMTLFATPYGPCSCQDGLNSVLAFMSPHPQLMSSALHDNGILYKGLVWTSMFVTACRWPGSTEDHAEPKACETRAAVSEVSPCDSTTRGCCIAAGCIAAGIGCSNCQGVVALAADGLSQHWQCRQAPRDLGREAAGQQQGIPSVATELQQNCLQVWFEPYVWQWWHLCCG